MKIKSMSRTDPNKRGGTLYEASRNLTEYNQQLRSRGASVNIPASTSPTVSVPKAGTAPAGTRIQSDYEAAQRANARRNYEYRQTTGQLPSQSGENQELSHRRDVVRDRQANYLQNGGTIGSAQNQVFQRSIDAIDAEIARRQNDRQKEAQTRAKNTADALKYNQKTFEKRAKEAKKQYGEDSDEYWAAQQRADEATKAVWEAGLPWQMRVANYADAVGGRLVGTAPQLAATLTRPPENEIRDNEFSRRYQAMNNWLQSAADYFYDVSAQGNAALKYGLGEVGSTVADVAVAGGEMLSDAAMNMILPGSGIAARGLRAGASGANEAYHAGATPGQEFMYGAATAAVEMLTEKMFDGMAKVYGAGAADEITEGIVRRLAETNGGRTLARILINTPGEGIEEVVSDLANPFIKYIYDNGAALQESYGTGDGFKSMMQEAGYDFLIGALLGVVGAAASVTNGEAAAKNARLALQDDFIAQMSTGDGSSFFIEPHSGQTTRFGVEQYGDTWWGYAIDGQGKTYWQNGYKSRSAAERGTAVAASDWIVEQAANPENRANDADVRARDEQRAETAAENPGSTIADDQAVEIQRTLQDSGAKNSSLAQAVKLSGIVDKILNGDTSLSNNAIRDLDLYHNKGLLSIVEQKTGEKIDTSSNKRIVADVRAIVERRAELYAIEDEQKTAQATAATKSMPQTAAETENPAQEDVFTEDVQALHGEVENAVEASTAAETSEDAGSTEPTITLRNGRTVNRQQFIEDIVQARNSAERTVASDAFDKLYAESGEEGTQRQAAAQQTAAPAQAQQQAEGSATTQRTAQKPGLIRDEYTKSQEQRQMNVIDLVAKRLGVTVRFVDRVKGGDANAQLADGLVEIEKYNRNPVLFLFGHEITHHLQEIAPESYLAFRDAAMIDIPNADEIIQKKIQLYADRDVRLDRQSAMDELAADYAGQMVDSTAVLERFIERHKENRSLLQRLADAFRSLIDRVGGRYRVNAKNAVNLLEKALRDGANAMEKAERQEAREQKRAQKQASRAQAKENTATRGGEGEARYHINEGFSRDIQDWNNDGRPDGDRFILGSTGPVLQGLGAIESDIYLRSDKINRILEQHPEMSLREIQRIPEILEDPTLILKSKGENVGGQNTRMVIFGSLKAQNGKPVLVSLDLRPVERGFAINDMQKVNSAYAKDKHLNLVKSSDILFADKKRTIPLLRTMGLQSRPIELQQNGYVGSIAYVQQNVKMNGVPFSSVVNLDGNAKFSLKEPVERTKDLIAVHNKDWAFIRDAALNWGGMPSPSIAIVDAQEGHAKYGDTSVVFPRATIDPEADPRNKVYGGDAWTPTHQNAQVEREVNYNIRRAFEQKVQELGKDVAGGMFSQSSVLGVSGIEDVTGFTLPEIAEKLGRNDAVKAAYLASIGRDVKVVYKTKEYDRFGNAALDRYLAKVDPQELARLYVKLATGEKLTAEEMKPAEDAIRENYEEKHAGILNRRPEGKAKKIAYYMENNVFPNRVEDFIRHAQELYNEGGGDEIDRMATRESLQKAADNQTVAAWAEEQLQGLLGEPGIYNGEDVVTDSGRRSFSETHWDYTAENIVKAMNMAANKGANMYGVTPETLAATATPEYRNVDEMHADEGRLRTVSEEEHAKALQDLGIYLDRVVDDLMRTTKHQFDNSFEEEQNLSGIIAEAAKGKKTVAAVKAAFRKEGYTISDGHAKNILSLIDRAANIPTGYYEAKAQRVVPFSEAAAIIAPTSAPAEEVAAVKAATGVNIIQYETGNEEQRKRLANGLVGVKFSLKEDSKGRALTEAQREYFRDSKAVDDQGRLMVMYHGTNADFTVFDKGRIGQNFQNRGGDLGFYFSPYIEDARGYAREAAFSTGGEKTIMEVYLNLKNPLVVEDEGWGSAISQADIRHGDLKRWAQEGGYDGIIVKSTDEVDDDGTPDAVYIAFSPEQIKSVTNQKPTSDPDIRYSLKPVPPVRPNSKDWRPGATFDEVKAAHPTLFALDADEADTRNPTQISGTVKSYRKIYDALKAEGFDGTILDASSGLGYGTRAGREEYGFDVDDIEPFPDAKYRPNYTDYSALDKTYDVIISNAVLNVMPQDLRDAMVVKIGEMLNPGGRAFINVRGTDVKNAGSKVAINDDLMEYFISNTGSYQKGFTSKELASYLKDALGDGFTVEPTKKFGAISAIVTRDGDRLSLKEDSDGRSLTKAQQAYFKDSKVRDEDGRLIPVYHANPTDNPDIRYHIGGVDTESPDAIESAVQMALALRDSDATPSEIFNQTGLVSLPDGRLRDGMTGNIVWEADDERRRKEGQDGSGGAVQRGKTSGGASETRSVGAAKQSQTRAQTRDRGVDQRQNRQDHSAGKAGTRNWKQLKNAEKAAFRSAVEEYLEETGADVADTLDLVWGNGGGDVDIAIDAFAQDLYSRIGESDLVLENELIAPLGRGNATSLIRKFRSIADEQKSGNVQYSMPAEKRTPSKPRTAYSFAKEVTADYASDFDKHTVAKSVRDIGVLLKDGDERTAAERAHSMAQAVVSTAAVVVNDEEVATRRIIRDYLKGTKLRISDELARGVDGIEALRNGPLAFMTSRTSGLPVDVAYMEMQASFGTHLFPEDVVNPADQLQRIADVLDQLQPKYENPFGRTQQEQEQAVMELAERILDTAEQLPRADLRKADTFVSMTETREFQEFKRQYDETYGEGATDAAIRSVKAYERAMQREAARRKAMRERPDAAETRAENARILAKARSEHVEARKKASLSRLFESKEKTRLRQENLELISWGANYVQQTEAAAERAEQRRVRQLSQQAEHAELMKRRAVLRVKFRDNKTLMSAKIRDGQKLANQKRNTQQAVEDARQARKEARILARRSAQDSMALINSSRRKTEQALEPAPIDTLRSIVPEQKNTWTERKHDLIEGAKDTGRKLYTAFVSDTLALEKLSALQVDAGAEGLTSYEGAKIAKACNSTIEMTYHDGLYDTEGNRIAEPLKEVAVVWKTENGKKVVDYEGQAVFQDYRLHLHNIDRMSLRERALQKVADFEAVNPWLREAPTRELALIAEGAYTDHGKRKDLRQQIVKDYVQLLKKAREAVNKPVFADTAGNPVTADASQRIVEKYEREYPDIVEQSRRLDEWWDTFMRTYVVGVTMSLEDYEAMREIYPHYTPTYRVNQGQRGRGVYAGGGTVSTGSFVKAATGSLKEVRYIEDSYADLVARAIRQNRFNALCANIVETAMNDDSGTFAGFMLFDWETQKNTVDKLGWLTDRDGLDGSEKHEPPALEKDGGACRVSCWINGDRVSAYISEDLYNSLAAVAGNKSNSRVEKAVDVFTGIGNKVTSPMKTLITGINPLFGIRNFIRDVPTAVVNSHAGARMLKYIPKAIAMSKNNSAEWQAYCALGGTSQSYYRNENGRKQGNAIANWDTRSEMTPWGKVKRGAKKAADTIGWFNELTENAVRFAEYLCAIDNLPGGNTYENRVRGIYYAGEVSVDFSRRGTLGRTVNAWIPYWNPAMQGIDKVFRSCLRDVTRKHKGFQQLSVTVARAVLTAAMPEALAMVCRMIAGREDEWEQLSDYVKDNFYCFPIPGKNNQYKFLKVPKNREWAALISNPLWRIVAGIKGREDPFANYWDDSIKANFIPPAAWEAIGIDQYLSIKYNEDFAGRPIVGNQFKDYTSGEYASKKLQYDGDTWAIAKLVSDAMANKLSPVQWEYIIHSYCGDLGDLLFGLVDMDTWNAITGSAPEDYDGWHDLYELVTAGPKKFVADARYSNAATSKYYETMDELGSKVADAKILDPDGYKDSTDYQVRSAIQGSYTKQIQDLNKQIREMADGPEKDALKLEVAATAQEALDFYNAAQNGEITQPKQYMAYEKTGVSATVRDALLALDGLSEDYKFDPSEFSAKKTIPAHAGKEWQLDESQKQQWRDFFADEYNERAEALIGSARYINATDARKAAMLEGVYEEATKAAKDAVVKWMKEQGYSPVKKEK